MVAFGRDENNRPFPAAAPPPEPTDEQVAMLLAIDDHRRVERLMLDLFNECQRGAHTFYSYMWFVTTALQRLHGINFQAQQKARRALQIEKRTKRAHQVEQLAFDDDAGAGDMQAVVGELARTKAIR
jgi:hypothetical protein